LDLGSGLVAVRIVGRRDGREKEAEEGQRGDRRASYLHVVVVVV